MNASHRCMARRVARVLASWGVAAALWLGAVAPCQADPPTRTDRNAALQAYRRAKDHYAAGRYRQAAEALQEARRHDPTSPTLVYNLARVYELLGRLDEAIATYRTYLELLPDEEQAEKDRIRGVLVRLEGARRELSARPDPAPRPPPPRPLQPLGHELGARYVERHVVDTPVLLLLGTAAAGLLSGAVTGAIALSRRSDVEGFVLGRDGDQADRNAVAADRAGWALASDVSFGVGLASLLGAGALYVLRTRTFERLPSGTERPVEDDSAAEPPTRGGEAP